MKAFFGIVSHTIRTAVRSRVFAVLLLALVIAIALLPTTVQGDGTATGQVQIVLTYSLSVVTVVLSLSSLWLSCSLLSREIESYTAHMLVTKPVRRAQLVIGKATGVFLLHAVLLALAGGCVFFLVQWRVNRGNFPENELAEVRREVLVGRRMVHPERPDFVAIARQEFERRVADGQIDPQTGRGQAMSQLLHQVKAAYTEIPFRRQRRWRIDNVPVKKGTETITVRYRVYVGSTSSSRQRTTHGVWGVQVPGEPEGTYRTVPVRVPGGSFQEFRLPVELVDEDGALVLMYGNEDPEEKSVIFQVGDGPFVLSRETGFAQNAARALGLVLLQLAFLSLLGTVVSALLSTPVAVFAGVSYLVLGMAADMAVERIDPEMQAGARQALTYRVSTGVARGLHLAFASPSDFTVATDLSRGRLVRWSRLGRVAGVVVLLQGGILTAAGIVLFNRRELGKVVRQ